MVTTVMPGTDRPCKKRQTVKVCMSLLPAINAVGTAKNSRAPTIMDLRPMASDSMPKKGDIKATAITVAPTAIPTCTSLALKSCINTGKIDWIE